MPVLTNIQIRSVAKFLKASCDKVPLSSPPPKHGQWLDILSEQFGYKDWNVTSAKNLDEPALVKTQDIFPISQLGFIGFARVISPNALPTHHLCYSEGGVRNRFDTAVNLAEKMRSQLGPTTPKGLIGYGRPDVSDKGQDGVSSKLRDHEVPIVVQVDEHGSTILLWWLSTSFLQNDPIHPAWGGGKVERSTVRFRDDGDHELYAYPENSLNTTLTELFLETLTGRTPSSRSCWYVSNWRDSFGTPAMLLVEEGNPSALQVVESSNAESWSDLQTASEIKNQKLGLSALDCEAISARYAAAETLRNEEPAVDFSGVYDD